MDTGPRSPLRWGRTDPGGSEFDGAYTAWGAFGQFITVFPAVDLVVAHKVRVPPYDRDVTIEQYVVLLKALVEALSESA